MAKLREQTPHSQTTIVGVTGCPLCLTSKDQGPNPICIKPARALHCSAFSQKIDKLGLAMLLKVSCHVTVAFLEFSPRFGSNYVNMVYYHVITPQLFLPLKALSVMLRMTKLKFEQ